MLFLVILFAQCHRPVVLERGDEMALPALDELEVLFRSKLAVHQTEAKLQAVVKACLEHLAQEFIFRHLTFALELCGHHAAILNRFFSPAQAPPEWTRHCSGAPRSKG